MTQLKIPLDVLLIIIGYADQRALWELSLTCRLISPHALQKLWKMPYITCIQSLDQLASTLTMAEPRHPYNEWISGLAVYFQSRENYYYYETIPAHIFAALSQTRLNLLVLHHVHIVHLDVFEQFMLNQLEQGIAKIHLVQCAPKTVKTILSCLTAAVRRCVQSICVYACDLTDNQVIRLVPFCPSLQILKLDRCGCFSDTALNLVAQNCSQLVTLVITLPSHIVQANTITPLTIEALELHCVKLKQFVCTGQIRISEYIAANHHHRFTISDMPLNPLD